LYTSALEGIPGIRVPLQPSDPRDQMSWCMYVIAVDEYDARIDRDALIDALRQAKIGTSVHYIPTHLMSAYRFLDADTCPETERAWTRLLSLPLFPSMSDRDVSDVAEAVEQIVARALEQSQTDRVHRGLRSRVNIQL
jgi:perosamine synthetase